MSQFIVVENCPHQSAFGQGSGNSRSVAGYPATTPLLGNVSGRSRAAGRIQYKVSGIRGHEQAALNNFGVSLDDITLIPSSDRVVPCSSELLVGEVVQVGHVTQIFA